MRHFSGLLALTVALGAATLASAQPMNQSAPQPQPGPRTQSSETPPPPSPSDPSITTMQQPISGNSSATSEPNSMAANASSSATRLAEILPEGVSPQEACNGFKSVQECEATAHAAKNLDVSFADLKSKVTSGQRLETAIHDLKPGADAKSEANRAEQQAYGDLRAPQG
jgi:hypothetical protein